MVNVSKTYNPYRQARRVNMLIEFDVTESAATNNATLSVNNQESISSISQLKTTNYRDRKYATCEDNLTMLDGTWNFLPDTLTNEHIGWWGTSISDGNGDFSTHPTLTANFSNTYSCVGFTIESAKSNPISECRVACYNGNTLIYDEVFESENHVMFADIPVLEFNKVIIEVLKTQKPRRRVKVLSFMVGILKRYDKDEIISANITEEADITSETLPISELSFEIYDPKKYFENYHSSTQYAYRQATKNATITTVNAGAIAKPSQLKDLTTKLYKYATCEDDFVMLDGTYRYLPDGSISDKNQIAFINNEISGADGVFSNVPKITYSWSRAIEFSGVRVFFGGDSHARKIKISAYNGDTLLGSETLTIDEEVAEVNFGSSQCTKIVMEFNRMDKGYRYLKIADIQVLRQADSWTSYITKGRNIKASIIIDGEKVNVGSKYMFERMEQNTEGLTTTIVAKDYIAKLDRQHCPAGSDTTSTLDTMLQSVLANSGITINYGRTSLNKTTVRATTPKDTSKRAAIHYLTQAAKATCFLDRNRVLQVRPFNQGVYVDTLNMDNIYKADIMRLNDYVNMIRLTVTNTYVNPEHKDRYLGGSGLYYREIENNVVNPTQSNGQAVANWLLSQFGRRLYFEMETRGNPALELGDTVRIKTREGIIYFGVIFSQTFEYTGGLKSTIKAVV